MKLKREAKLAITAIAAVIILIWGISFLKARSIFDRNNIFYGIYNDVDGLKVSSSVVYKGYNVGQITSIKFIGERYDKILVEFTVGKKLEIPKNTVAVIQGIDLMGTKAINLIPGDSDFFASSKDTLITQVQLGLLDQVNTQLSPLKNRVETVMGSIDTVLTSVQDILNSNTRGEIEESFRSLRGTLDNLNHLSGNLDALVSSRMNSLSSIIDNIEQISSNLKNNNETVSRSLENIASITDSLNNIDFTRTVGYFNNALLNLDSVVMKINNGEGSLGEMVNDDELYFALTQLSDNLNRFVTDFQANPRKYIRLSVFDFSSSRSKNDPYGVAIYGSEKPVTIDTELMREFPELREIRMNGRFLYIVRTFKKEKDARNFLTTLQNRFPEALVVKVS